MPEVQSEIRTGLGFILPNILPASLQPAIETLGFQRLPTLVVILYLLQSITMVKLSGHPASRGKDESPGLPGLDDSFLPIIGSKWFIFSLSHLKCFTPKPAWFVGPVLMAKYFILS